MIISYFYNLFCCSHILLCSPFLGKLQGVSAIVHLDKGNNDKATSQRFVQEAMLAMGRTVQEPIFQAIRSSPYYSILVDETTDVQIVKELIVYIR